jgi:biopolymer transport protein ExbD
VSNNIYSRMPENQDLMIDINTTPLIDVMLVLLIMLIITIPVQLHDVKLDMPTAPPQNQKLQDPLIIRVEIGRDGSINWNGEIAQTRERLQTLAEQAALIQPQPEIHIRVDRSSKYGLAAQVLSASSNAGLSKIGFVGLEAFIK